MICDMRYDKGFFFLGDRQPLSIMATVLYVPLRTVWRWPESRRMCYQPLSARMRERVGNEYRADAGTSAGDKDGLAEQSGCVENGHCGDGQV